MADQNDVELVKRVVKRVALGTVALVGIGLLLGSWYTVDEGERAVVLTMGEFSAIAEPGLNFKLPFLQSAREISVRNWNIKYDPYESYSFDRQTANIKISVNVRGTDVKRIYTEYGSLQAAIDAIITPQVPKTLKIVFGRYTAVRAIQERDKLNAEFQEALIAAVEGTGIQVVSTQIEDISFSEQYTKAVEDTARAFQEVEQAKQELLKIEQQAQQKVKQAEAEATAKRLQADADAYATEAAGKATAQAIRERGAALRDNPQLVDLVQAEKWNGQLPVTMVPGGAVPFINVEKK